MQQKKYLNFGQKVAYGLGDFGCNFCFTFVSSFVLIYLTDAVGLNSAVVGMLMMISKLLDGVTDVLFGTMIDKTHTRLGKARPWMIWTFVPLAVTVFLEFSIPAWSQQLQYAYFFVIYTLMNAIFYTIFGIACNTLTSLVTKNSTERVQLGVSRYVFALTAAMAISIATPILVNSFGGGTAGYRTVALIYAGIMVVSLGIVCLVMKELPASELYDGAAADEEPEKQNFWKNLLFLFTNKYFLLLLGINVANQLMNTIGNSVGIYYVTYIIGNAESYGLFSMAGMLPMILGLFLTPVFAKKYGMYKTNVVSMIIAIVVGVPYILVGFQKQVMLMLILIAIRGVFTSPVTATLGALTAEASRNIFLKTGKRMEGSMYACTCMGVKVGSGLGVAITGWLLALGGYDGMAAVQTSSALNMITIMFLVFPVLSIALQLVFMGGLKVEKENAALEAAAK